MVLLLMMPALYLILTAEPLGATVCGTRFSRRNTMPKSIASITVGLMLGGLTLAAQAPTKPAAPAAKTGGHEAMAPAAKRPALSDAAKIKLALSAAPPDISRNAAVMEAGPDGKMKELRAGTNGWMCMPEPQVMCLDKEWQAWADAWMNKKDPQVKTIGVAYMLRGDQGASNTDPFATAATKDNEWVVSPPHIMILTPDGNQLAALPTDWHNGGPWVMWKGTKYAHIMVPTAAMAKQPPAAKSTASEAK
jgi:hypothetical protein